MNAATRTLIDEINELLNLSANFFDRYNESGNAPIKTDLYEDLVYFNNRCKHIFSSIDNKTFLSRLRNFAFHISLEHKSQLHSFSQEIIEVRTDLKVTNKELENGLLYKISDLIKSEIFSNHLESAKYLLDAGHKDAAAVIIGGVLEDQLRSVCSKQGLPIKSTNGKLFSIEPMNINLHQSGTYNLLTQKQITTWADLRNNAAHGRYTEYTKDNVEDMYKYVLNFRV